MSEMWSFSSLDSTSSLRGRLAMTMVDLQGEEGKGEGGREVEAKGERKGAGEREMVTVAHTLVYPPPPPTPPPLHTHTLKRVAVPSVT